MSASEMLNTLSLAAKSRRNPNQTPFAWDC